MNSLKWGNDYAKKRTCKKCGKEYEQFIYDQIPDGGELEYDVCPYCSAVNGESTEKEFRNYRITEV